MSRVPVESVREAGAKAYTNRYRNGWATSAAVAKQALDDARRPGRRQRTGNAVTYTERAQPVPISRFQWPHSQVSSPLLRVRCVSSRPLPFIPACVPDSVVSVRPEACYDRLIREDQLCCCVCWYYLWGSVCASCLMLSCAVAGEGPRWPAHKVRQVLDVSAPVHAQAMPEPRTKAGLLGGCRRYMVQVRSTLNSFEMSGWQPGCKELKISLVLCVGSPLLLLPLRTGLGYHRSGFDEAFL